MTSSSCKEVVGFQSIKSMSKFCKRHIWGVGVVKTTAMIYGQQNENLAFEYARHIAETTNGTVTKSGIWINAKYPGFGSSPDGLVEECKSSGLVEIKCPKILENYHPLDLNNLSSKQLSKFCCKLENGKLILKQTHAYYYQIQMQLAICDKHWCDFVIGLRKVWKFSVYCLMLTSGRKLHQRYIISIAR